MEGNGVAAWLLSEGNVQSGLVYSLELVGGDEVGDWGGSMEHPLETKIRLISVNVIRIYLIFLAFCITIYYITVILCRKNFVLRFMGEVT